MDTSDPEIAFDSDGLCNHCRFYDINYKPQVERSQSSEGRKDLLPIVESIKQKGKGKDYDCLIGISGGVDSTYLALLVNELGLRPLAVHFDSGWNSELAVSNIENILKALKIDLHTVVCDWEEMRDLQLSYFKASLANCDVPTDHAIYATMHRIAKKYGIKSIIAGSNLATESILPKSWGHTFSDLTQLRAVQRKFGSVRLRNYPTLGFFQRYVWYPYFLGIGVVRLLNYVPYDKAEAKKSIVQKFGWRDYGGKHYESIFTRFFQAYYLPTKFGFDKRRAHLSSLICSGQMTRDDAMIEMSKAPDGPERLAEDKAFVAKKLRVTTDEFDNILSRPIRTFRDYPSEEWLLDLKNRIKLLTARFWGPFAQ